MKKVWVVVDIDGSIIGDREFDTEELAQAFKEGFSYFGDLLEVEELEVEE